MFRMAFTKVKLSSPIKMLLRLATGIACVLFFGRCVIIANQPHVQVLHLGFEMPGTQIELVEQPGDNPTPSSLRVTTPQNKFELESLEQLGNLVDINDAKQALHFVRFRTSRDLYDNWQGKEIPLEIVSLSQSSKPEFADTGTYCAGGDGWESGRYGLLSDQAYQAGKFAPPKVKRIDYSFQIIRWVCIYGRWDGTMVEEWMEVVTVNGDYHCTVLKRLPVPTLPGTQWYIYGLK